MLIEIHDNNTNETGTYKVWFKTGKGRECRRCSESFVNSLLDMRQKEKFFTGQYKFKISSIYDIHQLVTADPYKVKKHIAEI